MQQYEKQHSLCPVRVLVVGNAKMCVCTVVWDAMKYTGMVLFQDELVTIILYRMILSMIRLVNL